VKLASIYENPEVMSALQLVEMMKDIFVEFIHFTSTSALPPTVAVKPRLAAPKRLVSKRFLFSWFEL